MIPSEEEAVSLHRKHGSSEVIVEHCRTVARVAKILADELERKGIPVDTKAVVAGAMLHDIGRSKTHTVRHGIEGSEVIEREGVDSKVVEIVRKHAGAGLAPEEADRLGLPKLDYVPVARRGETPRVEAGVAGGARGRPRGLGLSEV